MYAYRSQTWMCLAFLAGLSCVQVQAADRQAAFWKPRAGSGERKPSVRPVSQEVPPPAPSAFEAPEILKSDTTNSPKQADLPAAMTLDELEQIALESNPTLVQAGMAVQAAEGRRLQAGLYPNPSAEYIADEIGNDGSEGLMGGGFSQEIVTRGKLRLGRAVAGHDVHMAQHGWEAQQRRVLNDVRAGYYEVLLAQKTVEVNEELVRIGNEGLQVAEKLRAEKEVSQADVLQARIEADMAKLNLQTSRNDQRAVWRRLAAVLGRPGMEPCPVAGDANANLPKLDWENTVAHISAQSPEIAQANVGVERARCDLALQYAERVPNFEVGSAVKFDTGSRYTVVDVAVSVPLMLFNRNQGNIAAAQAELVSAQKEVERVELDLRDRLAVTFKQYADARRRVETFRGSVLQNADESLKLTRAGYRAGELGYLTLLTAQRTYFGVSLEYLDSLRELWTRSVELEGLLLSGGLQGRE